MMLAFLGSIICMHPLDVGIMGENNRIYLVMMPFFSAGEHSIQKPRAIKIGLSFNLARTTDFGPI